MNIDERIIAGGITGEIVSKLIARHAGADGRYQMLFDYYTGDHAIKRRWKKGATAANNRIVCNHAKYIVDMTQSYLTGNAVTYEAAKEFDIEPLKNAYLEQDIASADSEIVRNMSIYGRAYELVYNDGDACPVSAVLPPDQAFVCYTADAAETPLFAVYYYRVFNIDGVCTEAVCRVYDDVNVYEFKGAGGDFLNLERVSEEAHYFGRVPVIEYRNNMECQGDFEQLISLIDAYNALMSDRVNDKEQFVDSLLFLKCCDINSEQAKKLLAEKVLLGTEDADGKYLSKVLNEADTEVLRDALAKDIHKLSRVPDLSDESFGGNLSGVAIKYKLLGFEQHIKSKERAMCRGLRKRFVLYNKFLELKGKMAEVPVHRVDIVFNHNLPSNDLELSQMAANLEGIVSHQTILAQLPFVTDAEEEAELAAAESAEGYRKRIERTEDLLSGGGY